jgi:hypothetical protein
MGLRLERHTTSRQSFGFSSQGMLGKAGPTIVGDGLVFPKGFALLSQLSMLKDFLGWANALPRLN